MRLRTCLLSTAAVFLVSHFSQAQHVSDDSVQYTPIPLPAVKEKKKNYEAAETPGQDHKVGYFIFLQSGILMSCHQCEGASSTTAVVNGITIGKKARAGVGIGFDSYSGWQTLPAYASLGYDLSGNKNRNAFFIQLNYGYSKAWLLPSFRGYSFQRAEGGKMFSPQVGYRLKYHELNVSFAVGAKFQRVVSYYSYPTWNWMGGDFQPGTNKTTIRKDISRIMISMAVGL